MKFTFYATIDSDSIRSYMPSVPILLPASSWARKGIPLPAPRLPPHITERAADCGGFVATHRWNGVYRYSPQQYVDWLSTWNPQWAATMDYCCENEITSGKPGIVRERQERTTAMAWHFWQNYRHCQCIWVPTVQGWNLEDYEWHATQMKPLLEAMHQYYGVGSLFRVGIGTLCRRANAQTIREVALAVSRILPGIPLHLWGIKMSVLRSPIALPEQVISSDSAAWHGFFAHGLERHKWAYQSSGMTKREYAYRIALPEYLAKIERTLSTPKQGMLL